MTRSTLPLRSPAAGRIGVGALLRAAMVLAAGAALVVATMGPSAAQAPLDVIPALAVAAEPAAVPTLRGDVVVAGDVVRFGDLVSGAPAEIAAVPVFHAPALGALGTIRVDRVVLTATALGVGTLETAGREQITVTRAARRIGQDAIAAALAEAIAARAGLASSEIEVVFDGTPPALLTLPETLDAVAITDLAFDPASRRFTATAFVGPSAAERRAQAPISGAVRRVVEVAVLTRSLARGDVVGPGDYQIERRPVEQVAADARLGTLALSDHVARRALAAGAPLRQADLERPMLVRRGESVVMVYERGALTLTLRGRARQDGAKGAVVDVENPTSERILQAEVIGPGAVRVGPAFAGRVAALADR